jgi:predicted component of type VI protein secretion system
MLMPTLYSMAAGPDIALDRAVVVVGRHPECDTWLDSDRVSRWHCVLAREGSEVFVRDLGSRNGTWINGRRVVFGRLKPGDALSIGGLRYRLDGATVFTATVAGLPGAPDSDSVFVLHPLSDLPIKSEEPDFSNN